MIRAAKAIKQHRDGIYAGSRVEKGETPLWQAAKREARNYRNLKTNFKTIVSLLTGKLDLSAVNPFLY